MILFLTNAKLIRFCRLSSGGTYWLRHWAQLQHDKHAKNALSEMSRNIEIIAMELVKGGWKQNYRLQQFFVCFRDQLCFFFLKLCNKWLCTFTDVEIGLVILFLKKMCSLLHASPLRSSSCCSSDPFDPDCACMCMLPHGQGSSKLALVLALSRSCLFFVVFFLSFLISRSRFHLPSVFLLRLDQRSALRYGN